MQRQSSSEKPKAREPKAKAVCARTIYFPPELDERVEKFARKHRTDRSRAVTMLVERGEVTPEVPPWAMEKLKSLAAAAGEELGVFLAIQLTKVAMADAAASTTGR